MLNDYKGWIVVLACSVALIARTSEESNRSTGSTDQNSNFSIQQLLLGIGSGAALYLGAPYLPILSKCAVATKWGIWGGKKIKGLISPSEEQQLQQQIAMKIHEIDVAQTELDECLLTHKSAGRDSLGIPIHCRDEARTYLLLMGEESLRKTIDRRMENRE